MCDGSAEIYNNFLIYFDSFFLTRLSVLNLIATITPLIHAASVLFLSLCCLSHTLYSHYFLSFVSVMSLCFCVRAFSLVSQWYYIISRFPGLPSYYVTLICSKSVQRILGSTYLSVYNTSPLSPQTGLVLFQML